VKIFVIFVVKKSWPLGCCACRIQAYEETTTLHDSAEGSQGANPVDIKHQAQPEIEKAFGLKSSELDLL